VAVRSLAPETSDVANVVAGGVYAGDEIAYIDQVDDDDDL